MGAMGRAKQAHISTNQMYTQVLDPGLHKTLTASFTNEIRDGNHHRES